MALTETKVNDKIEVIQTSNGYPVIQVRTATVIIKDEKEISRTFERKVLTPDADLAVEDADVAKVATAVFTKAVKTTYAEHMSNMVPTIKATEVI